MKGNMNLFDKVAIVIALLDILSFITGCIFYDVPMGNYLLDKFVGLNLYNIIFIVPISGFIGVIFNIVSLIIKRKSGFNVKVNVGLFIIFLLMIPMWLYFFCVALMSV